jgi:hypothetical protein
MPGEKSGWSGLSWPVAPVGNLTPPSAVQLNVNFSVSFSYRRALTKNDASPIPDSLPRADS